MTTSRMNPLMIPTSIPTETATRRPGFLEKNYSGLINHKKTLLLNIFDSENLNLMRYELYQVLN